MSLYERVASVSAVVVLGVVGRRACEQAKEGVSCVSLGAVLVQ
jgi:hypothetical protein